MSLDIDFVIIWVDGSDKNWLKQYAHYSNKITSGDSQEIRFRDFELLKYWFRGVEKFAPWVRKIHFITCGHKPDWLDTSHPKLNFVTHDEYIPKEYLPTFNSHTIELNLHRINDLSDNFVYFNDDMFITNTIDRNYFFHKNTPKDCAILNPIVPGGISHIVMNCVNVINNHFNKNTVIKNNKLKWFNLCYGKNLLRSFALLPWPKFVGFKDTHLPTAFNKSTFEKVWKEEKELLDKTCKSRFREDDNVSQYIFRYWQLAEGNFIAKNVIKGSIYTGLDTHTCSFICSKIKEKNNRLIVINDANIPDFDLVKSELSNAFKHILPEKSKFEK
ncbi:Stealth CR1 domain-containing protein [Morganella morganii]|uniref:Stealth CR1 domain-containing protein n=1 Tax=Morganella morganii TaxID=582 RepID=UPI00141934D9|nr:Stealth CR1 domain-containing protein [Morganella morganii]NIH20596.1 glycosyl transferase [Morganella morganii]QXO72828.1 Stealth CR1 domain-containing protein [Morganella morganii]